MAADNFDAFVTARSRRLMRTAYLLTHDHALAEDLVQTALAKAWFAWSRMRVAQGKPTTGQLILALYTPVR